MVIDFTKPKVWYGNWYEGFGTVTVPNPTLTIYMITVLTVTIGTCATRGFISLWSVLSLWTLCPCGPFIAIQRSFFTTLTKITNTTESKS